MQGPGTGSPQPPRGTPYNDGRPPNTGHVPRQACFVRHQFCLSDVKEEAAFQFCFSQLVCIIASQCASLTFHMMTLIFFHYFKYILCTKEEIVSNRKNQLPSQSSLLSCTKLTTSLLYRYFCGQILTIPYLVPSCLGNKDFILGDNPCKADCAIFGLLSQMYYQSFGGENEMAIKGHFFFFYSVRVTQMTKLS